MTREKTYDEIYGVEQAKLERQKRSLAHKGRKFTKQHRENLSKSIKLSYLNGRELSGICNVNGKNYSIAIGVWNKGLKKENNEKIREIAKKIKKTENDILPSD